MFIETVSGKLYITPKNLNVGFKALTLYKRKKHTHVLFLNSGKLVRTNNKKPEELAKLFEENEK